MLTIIQLKRAIELLLPFYTHPNTILTDCITIRDGMYSLSFPYTDKEVPEKVKEELKGLGFYPVGCWEYQG
jgi:hypothetical protein